MNIKEIRLDLYFPVNVSSSIIVPNIVPIIAKSLNNNEKHYNNKTSIKEANSQMFKVNKSQETPLRRCQRIRKLAIPNDYETYL